MFINPWYAAGTEPRSVAVGDLDGANGPDLAVANRYSDDVSVLLNQGNGTFAAAVAYTAGDGPQSAAIGDLDGVNGPDLAVANGVGDDVSVLLNQGDGTFAAAVVYAAGDGPISVAIGDLDGVNGPDLAVANFGSDEWRTPPATGRGRWPLAIWTGPTAPTSPWRTLTAATTPRCS
ncbi:MAG: FG-GAP-like repeat-containing protein [Planctomycetota bacterium]